MHALTGRQRLLDAITALPVAGGVTLVLAYQLADGFYSSFGVTTEQVGLTQSILVQYSLLSVVVGVVLFLFIGGRAIAEETTPAKGAGYPGSIRDEQARRAEADQERARPASWLAALIMTIFVATAVAVLMGSSQYLATPFSLFVLWWSYPLYRDIRTEWREPHRLRSMATRTSLTGHDGRILGCFLVVLVGVSSVYALRDEGRRMAVTAQNMRSISLFPGIRTSPGASVVVLHPGSMTPAREPGLAEGDRCLYLGTAEGYSVFWLPSAGTRAARTEVIPVSEMAFEVVKH